MQFKVFGCKVNKYYTEKWLKSEYLKDKSGIFIASCVVTDKAKRKWIKFVKEEIKKIKKQNKKEKIYISGCGAFKNGEAQKDFYDIYPELKEFENSIVLLGEEPKKLKVEKENLNLKNISKIYTKKFLLIQGGCDSFCSFCLTVIKRGRHYYRSKEDIVKEILKFEKSGGKEVVLTGINLAAWGLPSTNPPKILTKNSKVSYSKFAELLDYILKNTKIPRIRISSIGPEFIDDKCLEIFKEKRIYPHFHYSVQSGSSEILKKMRRHYDGEYVKDLLIKTKNLKRKDNVEVSIGADLIVGFPGESEKDFEKTYKLVSDGLITKIHAFPFSDHSFGEKVPASRFEDKMGEKTKKARMLKLENKALEIRKDFIKRNLGKKFEVLVESVKTPPVLQTSPPMMGTKKEQLSWKGWTENYIEASEKNFKVLSGEIKRNEIVKGILL